MKLSTSDAPTLGSGRYRRFASNVKEKFEGISAAVPVYVDRPNFLAERGTKDVLREF